MMKRTAVVGRQVMYVLTLGTAVAHRRKGETA
jgi:hypothetical protein